MNILCITHNSEEDYLVNNPTEELKRHTVTEVHTKQDALLMLRDGQFDIILCDLSFPHHAGDVPSPYGAFICLWQDIPEYKKLYKVKGIGILAPPHLKEIFFHESPDEQLVCFATNDCVTVTGQRDWKRILRMMKFRLKRAGIQIV